MEIQFADDLRSTVKVWVVREKTEQGEELDASEQQEAAGKEVGSHDHGTDD